MLRFGKGAKGDESKNEKAAVIAGASFVYGPIALVVVLVAFVGAASFGLEICYRLETPVEHYATRAAAEQDGAFRRGWLPTAIPPSAFDIHEVHNLDTNAQAARFRFRTPDLEDFKAQLEPVAGASAANLSMQIPRDVDWWPSHLVPPLDTGALTSVDFYRLGESDDSVCFALNSAGTEAFMWRCP